MFPSSYRTSQLPATSEALVVKGALGFSLAVAFFLSCLQTLAVQWAFVEHFQKSCPKLSTTAKTPMNLLTNLAISLSQRDRKKPKIL